MNSIHLQLFTIHMRKMMVIPHHKFPWCENKEQSLPTDKHNFSTERMISRSRPIVPIVIFLQCHFPDQSRNICQRHMVPVTERSVLRKFSLCTSCSSTGFALLLPPKKNFHQSLKIFPKYRVQLIAITNFNSETFTIHPAKLYHMRGQICDFEIATRCLCLISNHAQVLMHDFKSCPNADAVLKYYHVGNDKHRPMHQINVINHTVARNTHPTKPAQLKSLQCCTLQCCALLQLEHQNLLQCVLLRYH